MCILLLSTVHPDYHLILLSNRDEFLDRPTASLDWWTHPPTNTKVLSARDLLRPEQGTWLGVNEHGKLGVLTNFREEDVQKISGDRSRGQMVKDYLTSRYGTVEEFVEAMIEEGSQKGVGGFSLVCGDLRVRSGEEGVGRMAIVSNRIGKSAANDKAGPDWILEKGSVETEGLSNSVFLEPWPKVNEGTKYLEEVLRDSQKAGRSQEELVESLFEILSRDNLPPEPTIQDLRDSIFVRIFPVPWTVPADTTASGCADDETLRKPAETPIRLYGTRQQSVILVDKQGQITFIERTLWDEYGNALPKDQRDRTFQLAF
ncbi:DUF833-domain-containing protein [Saitoella complicata NRRL Y-17804]|uniref:Transport and Golgi organization protein 2 n=1 Tax=Saitoella complicata (strain BCRC 22490 / CBS 7301 / JCM 7358 / NBRC 10748 / NRRL Y-17804) TaxID=698492 RepID=A0A0E9NCS1_SAICN|nr:DUF833-domain-containing protein [Saitoella complicata NRRL Y-17804]ODQ52550.1 DUF833-domain-containing protein [Saitoella complicata NRRL Y-17804]GAO47496.1 hypothetical protein G7K_1702-t1 [Saitoella complicata NRRL Y-17804]